MEEYIILGSAIFGVGLFGAITRRGLLRMFIAIEIMLAGANVILASAVIFSGNGGESASSAGLVLLFYIWLFAIANAAIGLPLFLLIRSKLGADNTDELNQMQG